MPFIIFPQENNKLAVLVPTGEVPIENLAPEGDHAIVDSLEIDNDFFDAYEFHDGEAVVNIDKAKAIHLNRWREERAPKLAALDVAYMKAIEVEDSVKAAQIAMQKQALRDVTKTPLPDTLPELKATWPEVLN